MFFLHKEMQQARVVMRFTPELNLTPKCIALDIASPARFKLSDVCCNCCIEQSDWGWH